MANYEIEISFTREGQAQSVHGAVEAASPLEALSAVYAAFGDELERQGINSASGVTVNIWAVEVPQASTEVDNMPAGV